MEILENSFDVDPIILGEKIKKIRKSHGMTQQELGRQAGLTNVEVSRIENGTKPVTKTQIQTIADVFDISLDNLLEFPISLQSRNLKMNATKNEGKLTTTAKIIQAASMLFGAQDYTNRDKEQLLETLGSMYQLLHSTNNTKL